MTGKMIRVPSCFICLCREVGCVYSDKSVLTVPVTDKWGTEPVPLLLDYYHYIYHFPLLSVKGGRLWHSQCMDKRH